MDKVTKKHGVSGSEGNGENFVEEKGQWKKRIQEIVDNSSYI